MCEIWKETLKPLLIQVRKWIAEFLVRMSKEIARFLQECRRRLGSYWTHMAQLLRNRWFRSHMRLSLGSTISTAGTAGGRDEEAQEEVELQE